jgi:hypothetical protein
MAAKSSEGESAEATRKNRRKWLIGVATAVLVGGLTAIAAGLGEKIVDAIPTEDPALLSYGVEEQGTECGVATYLPGAKAAATIKGTPPFSLEEWERFRHQPEAAFAGSDLVQVSIQGESARTVTLTGIEFEVVRRKRKDGATFSAACGDALRGRGLAVDLEANPPRIVSSNETLEGIITASPSENVDTAPISFPWTVSLTDPLLLYVLTTARSCDCTWTAQVPWVSGSEKGTIRIDNGGVDFRVVGGEGLSSYSTTGKAWRQY